MLLIVNSFSISRFILRKLCLLDTDLYLLKPENCGTNSVSSGRKVKQINRVFVLLRLGVIHCNYPVLDFLNLDYSPHSVYTIGVDILVVQGPTSFMG